MVQTFIKLRGQKTQLFLSIFLVSFYSMANAEICGSLTVPSRGTALVYSSQERANPVGQYRAGTSLRISTSPQTQSDWVLIEWSGGQGWLHRSSFEINAFNELSDICLSASRLENQGANDGDVQSNSNTELVGVEINTQDDYSCLPPVVIQKINSMARRDGWSVSLVSAYRSRADNARRGGATNSYHIPCRAADFVVDGVSREVVEDHLIATWTGGLGLYCGKRFHIDNGPHRMWGGCADAEDRRLYYSRGRNRGGTVDHGADAHR